MCKSKVAILDLQLIKELRLVMGSEFPSLMEKFSIDSLDKLASIKHSLVESEWENARAIVHSLKGSAASIGADQLFELCKGLEQQCSAKGENGNHMEQYLQLERAFSQVTEALAKVLEHK